MNENLTKFIPVLTEVISENDFNNEELSLTEKESIPEPTLTQSSITDIQHQEFIKQQVALEVAKQVKLLKQQLIKLWQAEMD